MEKQIISVCSYCQKEYPEVDAAIKAAQVKYGRNGDFSFSHGVCPRHFVDMLKQMGLSDEEIQSKSSKENKCPDLKEHPDLVQYWSKGIFTKDQLQESKQKQKSEDDAFIARFKKLAGISH